MKIKQKKNIIIAAAIVVAVVIISLAVWLIAGAVAAQKEAEKNNKIAEVYAVLYQKPVEKIQEIKKGYDDWADVDDHLTREKYGFLEEERLKFIDEGYALDDIDKAEKYGLENNLSAKEILLARGKGKKTKAWDKIEKEFNIKKSEG